MAKIKVMTDSTCDLPASYFREYAIVWTRSWTTLRFRSLCILGPAWWVRWCIRRREMAR